LSNSNKLISASSSTFKEGTDALLRQVCEEWLTSLEHLSAVAYESDFKCFLAFYAHYTGETATLEKLIGLEPRDWRAWLSHQRSNGLRPKTVSRRLSSLKSFFRFLEKNSYIEEHQIFSSKTPKTPKTLPRPATYEEIMQLMECTSPDWIGKRDRALIFLLYSVGLRINEALSINCGDIEVPFQAVQFLTITGKGQKVRQVPLMPEATAVIAAYKDACPWQLSAESPLFVGERGARLVAQVFEARIRKFRKEIGLQESFTPHALRHSCATHLMAGSEDIRGIQELLGHASLSTTQIYTDVNSEQLHKAVCDAHPRGLGGRLKSIS
jgi:integrase/recombinase XerC